MHYAFCGIHKTLRVTPAVEAWIGDHAWKKLPALSRSNSFNLAHYSKFRNHLAVGNQKLA